MEHIITRELALKLDQVRADLDGKLVTNARAGVGGGKSIDYLDLPGLLDAVHPVLAVRHLALRTAVSFDSQSGYNIVEVFIQDVDTGESAYSSLGFSPDTSPREAGSAITYFMRYAILSALTQRAGKDNDAEGISAPPATQQRRTLPTRGR